MKTQVHMTLGNAILCTNYSFVAVKRTRTGEACVDLPVNFET